MISWVFSVQEKYVHRSIKNKNINSWNPEKKDKNHQTKPAFFLSCWFHVNFSGCNILTPLTTWRKPAFAIFGTVELLRKKLIQLSSHHFDHHSDILRLAVSAFRLSKRFPPFLRCSTLALSLANLSMTLIPCTSAWRFGTRETFRVDLFLGGGWVWNPPSGFGILWVI